MTHPSGGVALVTGAAGNLGAAVASALADAGYRLALTDLRPVDVGALDVPDPDRVFATECDVTSEKSVDEMIRRVIAHFAGIDVLVNVAGGFAGGTPVHETPAEVWDDLMRLNARSAFLVSSATIPHMLERESGRIVNIASAAARRGGAGLAAYSASKSAVVRLTESMAAEVGPLGINVNCVLPTTLDTPQNRAAMPGADTSRWIGLESLAGVVLFLASAASRDVHGAAIAVGS